MVVRRILKWIAWPIALFATVLLIAVVATARLGDASLYPPPPDQARVGVFVIANLHHSGLIVPRAALAEAAGKQNLSALAAVTARFAAYHWLEVGWGDEQFYTKVPTRNEFTVALALRALFRPGNPSVLHVVGVTDHPRIMYPSAEMATLTLGDDGFVRLAALLDATFARSEAGSIEELGRGLYGPSLFYRAVGTFSLLRVCNHWVADLLNAAGVPTAPILATLPQGLLWDLTARAGAVRLPAQAQ